MKKKKEKRSFKVKLIITTIVLGCLTLISTGLGMWFAYTDPKLCKDMDYDQFYSNWMSNLKNETLITDVVLPGSHDAGTNHMMPQAICQGHDILEQLQGGVRYFDLRVTNKQDKLVMYHGPIKGQSFWDVLHDFYQFMKDNPTEFIIMDFQHLGNELIHDAVIHEIKSTLTMTKMINSNKFRDIFEIDMHTIRDWGFNFLITWPDEKEALENNFYYRPNNLISEYDGKVHKESDEALIKQFDSYYSHTDGRRLFVLQAQRTAKTLLGKPAMYEKNFKPKVNKFIKNIVNDKEMLKKTNIIMRDFIISDKENINTILSLNIAKDLIKESAKENFINSVK